MTRKAPVPAAHRRQRGLLVRSHAGAAIPVSGLNALQLTFTTPDQPHVERTARIGTAAAELIQDGNPWCWTPALREWRYAVFDCPRC